VPFGVLTDARNNRAYPSFDRLLAQQRLRRPGNVRSWRDAWVHFTFERVLSRGLSELNRAASVLPQAFSGAGGKYPLHATHPGSSCFFARLRTARRVFLGSKVG